MLGTSRESTTPHPRLVLRLARQPDSTPWPADKPGSDPAAAGPSGVCCHSSSATGLVQGSRDRKAHGHCGPNVTSMVTRSCTPMTATATTAARYARPHSCSNSPPPSPVAARRVSLEAARSGWVPACRLKAALAPASSASSGCELANCCQSTTTAAEVATNSPNMPTRRAGRPCQERAS